jgi:SAM-dependent methyltransferase
MSGVADPVNSSTAISLALRERTPISDEAFDGLYPRSQRQRSLVHWTPIQVALRASEMLGPSPGGRILDVGSGAGKMCIVGALTSGAHWTGVELDGEMVRAATRVARYLDADAQTSFLHADGLDLDWRPFGGIYLFNPFSEAVFRSGPEDPVLRQATYIHAVIEVEQKLETLQAGARVVTLHGFGGEMPRGFELVESVPMHEDCLCLWVRVT